MRRRRALRTLAAAGLVPAAGCSVLDDGSTPTASPTATPSSTTTSSPSPTASVPANVDAAFDVAGIDASEETELNVPWGFTVRVRNATSNPQIFESTLSVRKRGSEWETFEGALRFRVPPGETRGWESPLRGFAYLGSFDYRLDALSHTWSVDVVPKTVSFDVSYTTPEGLVMTIGDVTFRSTDPSDGETPDPAPRTDGFTPTPTPLPEPTPSPAEPGERWALFPLTVGKRGEGTAMAPDPGEFTVRLKDGTAVGPPADLAWSRVYRAVELAPNERIHGFLPVQVPAGTRDFDVVVGWTNSYEEGDVEVSWDK